MQRNVSFGDGFSCMNKGDSQRTLNGTADGFSCLNRGDVQRTLNGNSVHGTAGIHYFWCTPFLSQPIAVIKLGFRLETMWFIYFVREIVWCERNFGTTKNSSNVTAAPEPESTEAFSRMISANEGSSFSHASASKGIAEIRVRNSLWYFASVFNF